MENRANVKGSYVLFLFFFIDLLYENYFSFSSLKQNLIGIFENAFFKRHPLDFIDIRINYRINSQILLK